MTYEARAERMLKRYYPNGFHADRWHFVDEELPTEWGFYLVATSVFGDGDRYVCVDSYDIKRDRWVDSQGHKDNYVVAWMPLPEPPKEEA